jgi:hypothetical protein
MACNESVNSSVPRVIALAAALGLARAPGRRRLQDCAAASQVISFNFFAARGAK